MDSGRPFIFIIDDDASVRRALGRVMGAAGFSWESFASADQFLATADLAKPSCILADLTLAGMSGLSLKRALNTHHPDIPLIFLTAHDTGELRHAAREAGAAGFLRKPVDSQALLDTIEWTVRPRNPQDSPTGRRFPALISTAAGPAAGSTVTSPGGNPNPGHTPGTTQPSNES